MKKDTSLMLACSLCLLASCEDKYTTDTMDGAIDQKIVTGRILDSYGKPFKGAEVKLRYEYMQFYGPDEYRQKATAVTDDKGVYRLSVLRKSDECKPDKDDTWNGYQLSVTMDEKQYFCGSFAWFDDVEAFWDTYETVVDDYRMYSVQFVTVTMNHMPPGATSCHISCFVDEPIANHIYESDRLSVSKLPFTAQMKIPENLDLHIARNWNNIYRDTLHIEAASGIPTVLNLSYSAQ